MNDEEMRVAIAEACGWSGCYSTERYVTGIDPAGIERDLPMFTDDLNAMHEAEKVLPCGGENNAFDRYVGALKEELGDEAICAPPRHRAIAFCRTLFPERFKV